MMVCTDLALCQRVALRYSLAMFPLCLAAPALGTCTTNQPFPHNLNMPTYWQRNFLADLTTDWFLLDSSILNLFMGYSGWRFYREANQKTAKNLFFFSIVYLPLLMTLFMLHKVQSFYDLRSASLTHHPQAFPRCLEFQKHRRKQCDVVYKIPVIEDLCPMQPIATAPSSTHVDSRVH
jgi:hypothetical protein